MVATPVTGAEGDEHSGRELPDLRLRPAYGIPAQRAQQPSPGPQGKSAGRPDEVNATVDPANSAVAPVQPGEVPQDAPAAPAHPANAPAGPVSPADPPSDSQAPLPWTRNSLIPGQPADTFADAAAPADPFAGAAAPADSLAAIASPGPVADAVSPAESVAAALDTPAPSPSRSSEVLPPPAAPTVESLPEITDDAVAAADGESGSRVDGPGQPTRRRHGRSSMRRQTSMAIAVLGWLAVSFLVLHRYLPDIEGLGSLLETWLPWLAAPILVLLAAAAIVHTRRALIAALAAALVWTALYGPALLPRGSSAPAQLHIFSEDVNGVTAEAKASGTLALSRNADVVALEDVYAGVAQSSAVNALNAGYKYHVTEYGFGLWSRYPISAVSPISVGTAGDDPDLSLGVQSADMAAAATGTPLIGALEATLAVPDGPPLTVFLVHLPQPVLGNSGFAKLRDAALTQFVATLKQNTAQRLAVIGDVNVAATDRQFSQLTSGVGLRSAQQAAGSGFGFTWPAEFPIVRLDDVLTRGLQPLRSSVLPAIGGGQAHLPIEVDLNY